MNRSRLAIGICAAMLAAALNLTYVVPGYDTALNLEPVVTDYYAELNRLAALQLVTLVPDRGWLRNYTLSGYITCELQERYPELECFAQIPLLLPAWGERLASEDGPYTNGERGLIRQLLEVSRLVEPAFSDDKMSDLEQASQELVRRLAALCHTGNGRKPPWQQLQHLPETDKEEAERAALSTLERLLPGTWRVCGLQQGYSAEDLPLWLVEITDGRAIYLVTVTARGGLVTDIIRCGTQHGKVLQADTELQLELQNLLKALELDELECWQGPVRTEGQLTWYLVPHTKEVWDMRRIVGVKMTAQGELLTLRLGPYYMYPALSETECAPRVAPEQAAEVLHPGASVTDCILVYDDGLYYAFKVKLGRDTIVAYVCAQTGEIKDCLLR